MWNMPSFDAAQRKQLILCGNLGVAKFLFGTELVHCWVIRSGNTTAGSELLAFHQGLRS
jgi:hypothetical protein